MSRNVGGTPIAIVSAPVALATKLEAFDGRGGDDYNASHDLEDAIRLIDGRPALVEEVRGATADLRTYLAERIARLLADKAFERAVPGHLMPDSASQARLGLVMQRLKELAAV